MAYGPLLVLKHTKSKRAVICNSVSRQIRGVLTGALIMLLTHELA